MMLSRRPLVEQRLRQRRRWWSSSSSVVFAAAVVLLLLVAAAPTGCRRARAAEQKVVVVAHEDRRSSSPPASSSGRQEEGSMLLQWLRKKGGVFDKSSIEWLSSTSSWPFSWSVERQSDKAGVPASSSSRSKRRHYGGADGRPTGRLLEEDTSGMNATTTTDDSSLHSSTAATTAPSDGANNNSTSTANMTTDDVTSNTNTNTTTQSPTTHDSTSANTATNSTTTFVETECRPFGLVPAHPSAKWIIGHRGASAHLPEHSLPAYRLAMELGATFVEPDLVPTQDGNFVAMHTPDLNITTNVADVFGTDRMWFSPYANQSSWYTFNFTTAELQNLTLKQRLPIARANLSDNLHHIPTLLDILQLVNHWNKVDRPQWSVPVPIPGTTATGSTSSPLQHAPVGVYAELKDYEWLLQDAGMDVVELLISHMNSDTNANEWKQLWNSVVAHPCRANHAGLIPPLVLQSFDETVLQKFHALWHTDSNSHLAVVGEPPYVLLVSTPNCWSSDFWTQPILMTGSNNNGTTSDGPQGFTVNGIGPDKNCLLDPVHGSSFVGTAAQKAPHLAIHPWTERPEFTSLVGSGDSSSSSSSSPLFASSIQELFHLFCDLNVTGVFAEAVATAVQVAAMGCTPPSTAGGDGDSGGGSGGIPSPPAAAPQDGGGENQQGTGGVDCPTTGETSTTSSVPNSTTTSSSSSSSVYVPVLSFLAGVVSTLGFLWYRNRQPGSWLSDRSGSGGARGVRRRRYRIGTSPLGEDDHDDNYRNHDLELT